MSALDRKVSGISPAVQARLFPTICDTLQANENGIREKDRGGAVIRRVLRQVARRTGKHEKTVLKKDDHKDEGDAIDDHKDENKNYTSIDPKQFRQ